MATPDTFAGNSDRSTDSPYFRALQLEIEAAGNQDDTEVAVDALLNAVLPDYWAMFADKGRIYPRLQYLYTLRAAIDFWERSVWRDVDCDEEVKESLRQKSLNLATMRSQADTDITVLEKQRISADGGCVGKPAIVGSLTPLYGSVIDPSDPFYRGDARRRGS